MADLAEVHLSTDGWEAIRLCDHEGLDHARAALRMRVSRPTFGRILERARTVVAKALVEGAALVIDLPDTAMQECDSCHGSWPGPMALPRCPICGSCSMLLLMRPAASVPTPQSHPEI